MKQIPLANVRLARVPRSTAGHGRQGTALMTLTHFQTTFGSAHELGSADDKITAMWYFDTPRGPVSVYDYWWNRHGEMSLGGSYRACLWFAAYLRALGVEASCRRWEMLRDRRRQQLLEDTRPFHASRLLTAQ